MFPSVLWHCVTNLLLYAADFLLAVQQIWLHCWRIEPPPHTVLRPFFRDHPGEPVPEENFWTLWCKGRLTETDTPTIRLGTSPPGLSSVHLGNKWHTFFSGFPQPGKPRIVREFCKPGKVREFEIWSGNFFYDMSHGSRLAYWWVDLCV